MKVWKWDSVVDEQTMLESDTMGYEKLMSFNGQSKTDGWEPEVLYRTRRPRGDVPNAPYFYWHIPLLDERAREALAPLVAGSAELLPAIYEDRPFWLVNVTDVLDCVDYRKSVYDVYCTGRVRSIDEYSLRADVVRGHNVFKIENFETGNPFVSDAFVEVVRREGLRGFKFCLVWSDEPQGDEIGKTELFF